MTITSVHATDHESAIAAMREDGVVVLREAVDLAHIVALRERMLADLPAVLARRDAPFNFNPDNVQQSPPRDRALLFADVLFNEHAIAVTGALMPEVKNTFYSGNTALPGTRRQPVHGDGCHLWRQAVPNPYAIVINVPLIDMHPGNGVTELWPGTHRIPYAVCNPDLKVPPELVEAQRRLRPPEQPVIPAGSLVLRDLRLWHAGMPNHSSTPRTMLAMVHNVGWWPAWEKPKFRSDTKDFFVHPRLQTEVEWVDEVDHNALDHPYEFAPPPAAGAAADGGRSG